MSINGLRLNLEESIDGGSQSTPEKHHQIPNHWQPSHILRWNFRRARVLKCILNGLHRQYAHSLCIFKNHLLKLFNHNALYYLSSDLTLIKSNYNTTHFTLYFYLCTIRIKKSDRHVQWHCFTSDINIQFSTFS